MWAPLVLITAGLLKVGLSSSVAANNINRPLLQEIALPKNLSENKTIRLHCSIELGDSVEFIWHLNDQKLDQRDGKRRIINHEESSELVIKSLSVDDLGTYSCIGQNKHGQDVQKVQLIFNAKPRFTKEPQDVTSSLTKEVSLDCDAKGYPPPTVRWYKLSDDRQKTVKEFKSNKISFEMSKENASPYRCRAQNSVGLIERTIEVKYFESGV